MLSRLASWFISTVLTILFLLFVLSNRETVTLAFWPFVTTVTAPLYLFFLLTVFVAFFMGLSTMWVMQHKHRATARRLQKELDDLRTAQKAANVEVNGAAPENGKANNTALIAPAIY